MKIRVKSTAHFDDVFVLSAEFAWHATSVKPRRIYILRTQPIDAWLAVCVSEFRAINMSVDLAIAILIILIMLR